MRTNLLILALLVISSGMMAQRTIWAPGGDENGDGFWGDEANWSNTLPGSEVDGRAIFKGGNVVVAGDVSPDGLGLPGDYRLEMGDNKDDNRNTVTIEDGGHVGAGGSWSAVGIWSPATLIVEEGGSLTTGGHLWIGATKSYEGGEADNMGSEVHLNGGTITVNGMFGIDFYNDKEFSGGILFLNGGLLDLAQWNPGDPDVEDANASLGKHGKIEYTNGLMKIVGDHKESLEYFRDQGQITGEFNIWVEENIEMIDDGEGGEIADTSYVTKLTNEDPPTSINSLPVEKVSISPNPANDYLNVSLSNDVIESVLIIDLSGKVAGSFEYGNANEATVQLQGIAEGLYIVKVKGKETTSFEKIIVKR